MKCLLSVVLLAFGVALNAKIIDRVVFGNPESEAAHEFVGEHTRVETNYLGDTARVIGSTSQDDWRGGSMSFTLKVSPKKPNYMTVRLWGSDINENLLILWVDGKQIGYRHLGDIDILDHGSAEPAYPGRSYYVTTPIPESLTHGKDTVVAEIHVTGRIWGYGRDFNEYQKTMTGTSRGIYAFYVHDNAYFAPPADEILGEPPEYNRPKRIEIDLTLSRIKRDLNNHIDALLSNGNLNQMQASVLARLSHETWSKAYRNQKVPNVIMRAIDNIYAQYAKDTAFLINDASTPNRDWWCFGSAADAILQLQETLDSSLFDKEIRDNKGTPITRRKAWGEMMSASVEYLITHRRAYTNQSMIIDLNLHRCNRALHLLDPAQARFPEETTLNCVYESVGLRPWRGNYITDTMQENPLGNDYYQLTATGLTKELGYVGSYGEVTDWMLELYDATPSPPRPFPATKPLPSRSDAMHRFAPVFARRGTIIVVTVQCDKRPSSAGATHGFPGLIIYAQRANRPSSPLGLLDLPNTRLSAAAMVREMIRDGHFESEIDKMLRDGLYVLQIRTPPHPRPSMPSTTLSSKNTSPKIPSSWANSTQPPPSCTTEKMVALPSKTVGNVFSPRSTGARIAGSICSRVSTIPRLNLTTLPLFTKRAFSPRRNTSGHVRTGPTSDLPTAAYAIPEKRCRLTRAKNCASPKSQKESNIVPATKTSTPERPTSITSSTVNTTSPSTPPPPAPSKSRRHKVGQPSADSITISTPMTMASLPSVLTKPLSSLRKKILRGTRFEMRRALLNQGVSKWTKVTSVHGK